MLVTFFLIWLVVVVTFVEILCHSIKKHSVGKLFRRFVKFVIHFAEIHGHCLEEA